MQYCLTKSVDPFAAFVANFSNQLCSTINKTQAGFAGSKF